MGTKVRAHPSVCADLINGPIHSSVIYSFYLTSYRAVWRFPFNFFINFIIFHSVYGKMIGCSKQLS